MDKTSFLSGLFAGAVGVVLVVVAVPGVVPGRTPERADCPAPRAVGADRVERPARPVDVRAPTDREAVESLPHAVDDAAADDTSAMAAELMKVKLNSNETAAIATLRNIISAQAQFQSTARADENHNGVGEYGSFGELSGAAPVRGGQPLNPPVLSSAFRAVNDSCVERNGYLYRIYLPRAGDGHALVELPEGGFEAGAVHAELAETTWCIYAWPKEKGKTGTRTFFTNQAGDVVATSDADYAGNRGPEPYAAFAPNSVRLEGVVAIGERANDGHVWKQAG